MPIASEGHDQLIEVERKSVCFVFFFLFQSMSVMSASPTFQSPLPGSKLSHLMRSPVGHIRHASCRSPEALVPHQVLLFFYPK